MIVDHLSRARVETEALVIGYAMSRLDARYLIARNLPTWQAAFTEASIALARPASSFNNLRDEFDPIHPNPRRGWYKRPMRQNRQRILDEMAEVSDTALLELVRRILLRDEEATVEAIDALAVVTRRPANVAERLLTGRRAEDYFLAHCWRLVNVERAAISDMRLSASGFDFGIVDSPDTAIEVKGMKQMRGGIQFTDREWTEAERRRSNYLLVVVGNLATDPIAAVLPNPFERLPTECRWQTSITAVWQATFSIS